MRRKGSVSSPGYRTERRDPQPRDLCPRQSQSKITTRPTTKPTIGNHNRNPDPQPDPRQQNRKKQVNKRGKKTGEGYRSVMVERKSMMAHIHEWEENRATGKMKEEREWKSGDGGGEF